MNITVRNPSWDYARNLSCDYARNLLWDYGRNISWDYARNLSWDYARNLSWDYDGRSGGRKAGDHLLSPQGWGSSGGIPIPMRGAVLSGGEPMKVST